MEIRERENRFVKGCQNGQAADWEELIRQHTRRVYGMCFRFTRRDSDARDLSQEVFLRVYRTLGTFRSDELSFVAWLNLVTRNLLLDHYRRTRRDRDTVSIDAQGPGMRALTDVTNHPDRAFDGRETSRILHSALSKLPPELRETIVLYDLRELRYREIAEVLGIPEGTVKSRLNRGRATLAHMLRRYKFAARTTAEEV